MHRIDPDDLSRAGDSAALRRALQAGLQATLTDWLPLAAVASRGGLIDHDDISLSVLDVQTQPADLVVRVGVFFTEVVGGCNCHDDPVRHPDYTLFEVRIDRASGRVQARPVSTSA